jgi:hypothetical protein
MSYSAHKHSGTGIDFIMDLYRCAGNTRDPQSQINYVERMLATNSACEAYEDPEYPGVKLYREVGLDLGKLREAFLDQSFFDNFVARTKLRVINYPGRCGWTLLGACAKHGAIDLAKWVLQHGGNPDHCNGEGESMKKVAESNLSGDVLQQFMAL